MKIATLLFTYHRYEHTKKTIDALSKNTELPEYLIVFQDGKNNKTDIGGWDKVNALINEINFCPTEVIVHDKNRGLANSIVEGINYAMKSFDAVIVIEDDCVTAKGFMSFMVQALKQYEQYEKVLQIGGYSIPFFDESKEELLFYGRAETWGWATWKEKWKLYDNKDRDLIERICNDKRLSTNLGIWGGDLFDMYCAQIEGKIDSWAVFWALSFIENDGVVLAPRKSLVSNIGLDGSGTNCTSMDIYDVCLDEKIVQYNYPKEIVIDQVLANNFSQHFGYGIAQNTDASKPHVIIYGLGIFFRKNAKWIMNNYYIEGVMDKKIEKYKYYLGKKVMSISDAIVSRSIILIMIMDVEESIKIKNDLVLQGIDANRILTAFGGNIN